jgi:hypothetical protein
MKPKAIASDMKYHHTETHLTAQQKHTKKNKQEKKTDG